MRRLILTAVAAAIVPLALSSTEAAAHAARSTDHGLAGMHKLHIEKGRLCMADHDHFGQTGAWPTLAEARAKAVKSWVGFTRLEYGDAWSDFRVAVAAKFDCARTSMVRGEGWSCTVKARPCKR